MEKGVEGWQVDKKEGGKKGRKEKECINGGLVPPFRSTFYTLFGFVLSQPLDLDYELHSSMHQDGSARYLQLACFFQSLCYDFSLKNKNHKCSFSFFLFSGIFCWLTPFFKKYLVSNQYLTWWSISRASLFSINKILSVVYDILWMFKNEENDWSLYISHNVWLHHWSEYPFVFPTKKEKRKERISRCSYIIIK